MPIFANFCIALLIQIIVTIVTKVIFNWLAIRLYHLFIYYFFKPFAHRSRSLSFFLFSFISFHFFYFLPFLSFLLFPSISFISFYSFHSFSFLSFPSV